MASGMKESGKHASPADAEVALSCACAVRCTVSKPLQLTVICYTRGLFDLSGGARRRGRCGAACQAHNVGQAQRRGGRHGGACTARSRPYSCKHLCSPIRQVTYRSAGALARRRALTKTTPPRAPFQQLRPGQLRSPLLCGRQCVQERRSWVGRVRKGRCTVTRARTRPPQTRSVDFRPCIECSALSCRRAIARLADAVGGEEEECRRPRGPQPLLQPHPQAHAAHAPRWRWPRRRHRSTGAAPASHCNIKQQHEPGRYM